jgi:hypothetical protein
MSLLQDAVKNLSVLPRFVLRYAHTARTHTQKLITCYIYILRQVIEYP